MLQVDFRGDRAHLRSDTPNEQKVYAMLKIAPSAEVAQSRPPVALALVIDTSGSMLEYADQAEASRQARTRQEAGQLVTVDGRYRAVGLDLPHKLDEAKKAARALIDDPRLAADDRLTLCHFDDEGRVLLPLSPLVDRQAASQAVESLVGRRGTRMAHGLECVRQQLAGVGAEIAKRVVLLTDGRTTDERECRQLAAAFAEQNTPIVAVGLGTEYNEDLMRDLAQDTQGRPYHLRAIEQLPAILNLEIGSVVCEVATDLELTVAAVRGVTLDRVTRVYPSIAEVSLARVPHRLGNIASGDFTVFILEFSVAGMERPSSRVRLAEARLAGHAHGAGGRQEVPPQEIFVNFSPDAAAAEEVNPEVWVYIRQRDVDHKIQEALKAGHPVKARQILAEAIQMAELSGHPEWARMLREALDELDQTGAISSDTRKTVSLSPRTRTTKPVDSATAGTGLSDEEIQRITGLSLGS